MLHLELLCYQDEVGGIRVHGLAGAGLLELALGLSLELLVVPHNVRLHVLHGLDLVQLLKALELVEINRLLLSLTSSSVEVLLGGQGVLVCHWILPKGTEVRWPGTLGLRSANSVNKLAKIFLLGRALVRLLSLPQPVALTMAAEFVFIIVVFGLRETSTLVLLIVLLLLVMRNTNRYFVS